MGDDYPAVDRWVGSGLQSIGMPLSGNIQCAWFSLGHDAVTILWSLDMPFREANSWPGSTWHVFAARGEPIGCPTIASFWGSRERDLVRRLHRR
jgi:hypothetical protein